MKTCHHLLVCVQNSHFVSALYTSADESGLRRSTWRKEIWFSVWASWLNSASRFFSSAISCSSWTRSSSAWLVAALSWAWISSFTSVRRRSIEQTSSVKIRSLSSNAAWAESWTWWKETKNKVKIKHRRFIGSVDLGLIEGKTTEERKKGNKKPSKVISGLSQAIEGCKNS